MTQRVLRTCQPDFPPVTLWCHKRCFQRPQTGSLESPPCWVAAAVPDSHCPPWAACQQWPRCGHLLVPGTQVCEPIWEAAGSGTSACTCAGPLPKGWARSAGGPTLPPKQRTSFMIPERCRFVPMRLLQPGAWSQASRFTSQLPAGRPWAGCLTSLCPSFLFREMGRTINLPHGAVERVKGANRKSSRGALQKQ